MKSTRPLPRLNEEWHYISFKDPDGDHVRIMSAMPEATRVDVADQQPPWVTLRYPALEEPAMIANLHEIKASHNCAGIVQHHNGEPVYAPRPAEERVPLITGVALIEATLPWIKEEPLRTLVRLVHRDIGFMFGLVCTSYEHIVKQHVWPEDASVYDAKTLVWMYARKTPTPPELLCSLLASIDNFPTRSKCVYPMEHLIMQAWQCGVDKR